MTDNKHRTTLYLPHGIAKALKRLACDRSVPVNRLVIEAIEGLLLAATGDTGQPEPVEVSASLRRDIAGIQARLTAVETALAVRPSSHALIEGAKPALRAHQVRLRAAEIIRNHGRPMPHRDLLEALEAEFVLPGRQPSEVLRTTLVHPRSPRGFHLIPKQGYWLDGIEKVDAGKTARSTWERLLPLPMTMSSSDDAR